MKEIIDIFLELWPILVILAFGGFIGYLHGKHRNPQNKYKPDATNKDCLDDSKVLTEEDLGFLYLKKQDMIHDKKVTDFIFCGVDQLILYIHYTYKKEDADNILKNGFNYIDSFYKTATLIVNDRVDFVYKHNLHKRYGKYAIIIGISRSLYDRYLQGISKLGDPDLCVEHLFTEKEPYEDNSGEIVYTCPPQFIRGYVNYESGEIIENEIFEPEYDSPFFLSNLKNYEKPQE